jgi:hypothetical protein
MTQKEAADLLDGEEVVDAMHGAMNYIREIEERCLDAGIPVAVDRCREKTCGTKLSLLVREADLPRVGALLNSEFQAMVEREGTDVVKVKITEEGELPCPACGTAAPLVEGACSDCGLNLE